VVGVAVFMSQPAPTGSAPPAHLPVDVGARDRTLVVDVPGIQKQHHAPAGQHPARPEVAASIYYPHPDQERIDNDVCDEIAPELALSGIAHGFFTRQGGHSTGLFSSLNCGLGSGDDILAVRKNRASVAHKLGVAHDSLISGYQVHGTDVAVITGPMAERPQVDALVTNTPGVALGILTADCGPVLFADHEAGVIGACHAGWKGALGGVTRCTVVAMEKLGAKRGRITAVLGPTISQTAYEVGPEFPKPFLTANQAHQKYFIPSLRPEHYMFDLQTFLIDQLREFGLGKVSGLGLCTYADEHNFFSYRRATHRSEKDYGRLVSAIAIRE